MAIVSARKRIVNQGHPMPLRCVIVDDHRFLLHMLTPMLYVAPGVQVEVVATATTVSDGQKACEIHLPDLLILDLSLPDGSGLRVARKLIAANREARVIILTGQSSTFVCPAWLNGNIHAVVNKTQAFESLRRSLMTLGSGPAATAAAADAPAAPSCAARPLTHREQQILALIGTGLETKEIATRLGISAHTVSAHRKKIAEKLGTSGSALRLHAFRFSQQLAAPAEENN